MPGRRAASGSMLQIHSKELHAGLREALEEQRQRQERLFAEFFRQLDADTEDGVDVEACRPEEHRRASEACHAAIPSSTDTKEGGGVHEGAEEEEARAQTINARKVAFRKNCSMSIREDLAWLEASIMPPSTDDKKLVSEQQSWFARGVLSLHQWWRTLEEPRRSGMLYQFSESRRFTFLCIVVILVNGALIIHNTNTSLLAKIDEVSSSTNDGTTSLSIEYAFLAFYVAELCLKLAVHRQYFFVNEDSAWNVMDLALVCVSVVDIVAKAMMAAGTSVNMTFLRSFRLLKVSKVFRMFRALKFISELRLMLDCLLGCFMQLFWALVLLGFLLCLFSIFFVQGFTVYLEDNATISATEIEIMVETFGSVPTGMRSLFQACSGGTDWSDYYKIIAPCGPLYAGAFIFFIMFMMVSVMNIVTSIFIDRAMKLAKPEDDSVRLEAQRQNLRDTKNLLRLCEDLGIDQDGDGWLTHDDLKRCMTDEKIREHFDVRGISFEDTNMFYRMLSVNTAQCEGGESHGGVDIFSFVMGLTRLKGFATSLDLHTLAFEIKLMHRSQRELVERSHFLADHLQALQEFVETPNPLQRDGHINGDGEEGRLNGAGRIRDVDGCACSDRHEAVHCFQSGATNVPLVAEVASRSCTWRPANPPDKA